MRVGSIVWMALAIANPVLAAKREPRVPAAFQGEWNANARDCGTALNDSRLRIDATTLTGYESSGPVRAVVSNGPREIALISEMRGEGETWLQLSHYKLDRAQRVLTDVTNEGSPLTRYRCPAKK